MSDEEIEERIRDSLHRLDLPEAPGPLIQRAEQLCMEHAPARSSRAGLVLVVAAVVAITVYGSMLVASGGSPTPPVSPTPSASQAASATASGDGSDAPTDRPTPTPTLRPFPVDRPEPSAPAIDPAPDDDLALAGHGDVPGLLDCGFGLPFSVDALQNPTGAEDLPGPEYDALQDLIDRYLALGASELGPDPTAREVAHDATSAMFLVDSAGSGPGSGFPFVPISIDLVDHRWEGSYGVDCQPRAVLPPGYERATWTVDPAYTPPTPESRALHLLVQEHVCSSGRAPYGRIGPAYVVATRFEVAIEVVVKRLPGGQDCQSAPPAKARLSLPEPIGDRFLRDTDDYLHNQSGG